MSMTKKLPMRVLMLQAWLLSLLLTVPRHVASQECAADGVCDTHDRCSVWKDEGECYRTPDYMEKYCPVSCRRMGSEANHDCHDAHPKCQAWAKLGECKVNDEMRRYCPKACGTCTGGDNQNQDQPDNDSATDSDSLCTDQHKKCSKWAAMGECDKNPNYMLENCANSCGTCHEEEKEADVPNHLIENADTLLETTTKYGDKQSATGKQKPLTLKVVEEMIDYMENSDDFMALPTKIQANCRNRHELCAFWSAIGECSANMAFMKIQCAPACKSCHLIDMANRCPELPDAVPGLKPGDLNEMFQRIVQNAPGNKTLSDEDRHQLGVSNMTEYSVVVHSRPSDEPATDASLATDKKLPPWVITLENFLTHAECDALIQLGHEQGYKRSEDVGKEKFDGTVDGMESKGRTSENAWCSTRKGCREEPVPSMIHGRIAELLGIPPENSEDFQILRYEVGQFYNTHHDYIPHQKTRQCGPRILTFFMYLSDVDAGGGTDFPRLGITVMPKKGRALLWPSVYNTAPMMPDKRMDHQALPVEAGTKFAANGWIHMYDYLTPQSIGCN